MKTVIISFMLLLLVLVLFFKQDCYSQTLEISICQDLQNIIVNNNTVVYKLIQDVDCYSFNFNVIGGSLTNQSFKGTLDGQNYSINFLSIIGNSTINKGEYSGVFAYGINATIINLFINNFYYDMSNNSNFCYGGMLFGVMRNSTICNCHLGVYNNYSSNNNSLNIIIGSSSSNNALGGFVGWMTSGSSILNSSLENTFIKVNTNCGGSVGGIVGEVYDNVGITRVINCTNNGITNGNSTFSNNIIIQGNYAITGGIIGNCVYNCYVNKCGVTGLGIINTTNYIGGIIGIFHPLSIVKNISELYVKDNITICGTNNIGGIIGNLAITNDYIFSNFYMRGKIVINNDSVIIGYIGGIIGRIVFCTNNSLTLQSGYTISNITMNTTNNNIINNTIGYVIGCVLGIMNWNQVYFNNTYFYNYSSSISLNNINQSIFINNSQSQLIGFNSTVELYEQLNSSLDQCNVWYGNELQCENTLYQSIMGNCGYSSIAPITTIQSTTIESTTIQQTTIQQTTIVPTNTIQSTTILSSSLLPLSTITPTTITPTTNNSITLNTIISTTIIPTTTVTTNITTIIPTTIVTNQSCFYQVPYCYLCSYVPPLYHLNISLYNISCVYNNDCQLWQWQFSNKTSLTTIINDDQLIILSSNNTLYIEGNLIFKTNIILYVDKNITLLNVNGCLSFDNNNLTIIVTNTSFVNDNNSSTNDNKLLLISYNCTNNNTNNINQQYNSSSSSNPLNLDKVSITLNPTLDNNNDNNDNCNPNNAQIQYTQNGLFMYISCQNNINKNNFYKTIIILSCVLPVLLITAIIIIISILRYIQQKQAVQFMKQFNFELYNTKKQTTNEKINI